MPVADPVEWLKALFAQLEAQQQSIPQATVIPGTASVTVTAYNSVAQVSFAPATAAVTTSVNTTTEATSGVLPPADPAEWIKALYAQIELQTSYVQLPLIAQPGVANVTVQALQPLVTLSTVTALPGLASVTVTAYPPTTPTAGVLPPVDPAEWMLTLFLAQQNQSSVSVPQTIALPTTAFVNVTGYDATVTSSTTVVANAGVANVTVTAYNSVFTFGANPGVGAVSVDVLPSLLLVAATPTTANVLVQAFNIIHGAVGTVAILTVSDARVTTITWSDQEFYILTVSDS